MSKVIVGTGGVPITEQHELLGVLHGKCAKDECVHDAEDGRIRAYTQSHARQYDNCEGWAVAQHAYRISYILPSSFEPLSIVDIAALFLHLFDSSGVTKGGLCGFFRRQTLCYVTFGLASDVVA